MSLNAPFVAVSAEGLRIIREQLPPVAESFARNAHPVAPALQEAVLAFDEIK